jgi:hypothetical protein
MKLHRQYATIGVHRVGPTATITELTAADGLLGVDIGPLIEGNMIQETNDTVTIDPVATAAARDFENFLLHHDPEKVLTLVGKDRENRTAQMKALQRHQESINSIKWDN